MRRRVAAVLAILAIVLPTGTVAEAQLVTGSIVGVVQDSSGGTLAGAVVTVSSPTLLGGDAAVSTTENGTYRFPRLSPGHYTLTVEAVGFQRYEKSEIPVVVGRAVQKRIVMSLDGVTENLTVVANADWIDPKKISLSSVYDQSYVDNLPRPRADFSDFLKIAPGMSPTRDRPGQPDTSAMGSGTDDNLYLIDGGDMTGTTKIGGNTIDAPWVGSDQIESVEIINTGASAEYGNYQGAVVHVHTRRGGNDFRFQGAYFHDNDFTVGVGGPILRDKLWFYGGYEYRYPLEGYTDRLSMKLDWQITSELEARFGFQGGTQEFPPVATPIAPIETQSHFTNRVPSFTFGQLTYVPSNDTLIEMRASGLFRTRTNDPIDTSEPHRWDLTTDISSGGSGFIAKKLSTRIPISAKLTHFVEDRLNADHELKVGLQFNYSSQVDQFAFPTGVDYIDDGGPYLAFIADPTTTAANVNTFTVFGEDVASVGGRGTIHLGLRVDHNRSSSPDVPQLTASLDDTGQSIAGLGPLYSWITLSPRLGATFALTEDGRTLARGSWGRYLRSAFAGELAQFHPANGPETTAEWDPETGDYSNIVSVFDPLEDLELDPNLRALRTDTLSLGLDRQFGERSVLNVSYVYKNSSDFTGWSDIGGIYGQDVETLPDGSELTVYPLLNSRNDQRFLLTNRPDWYMNHHGLHVTFQSRWRQRWRTLLSYSGSRTEGVQSSVVLNPGATQMSSGGFVGKQSSSDPNSMTNAEGPLSNERAHLFRVQAVGEIPNVGVIIGANFQYLTGAPWAGKYQVRLPQGRVNIFVEPQGTRRLPPRTLLDLRVSKVFRFGNDTRLELLVDIFNAFDQSTPQSVNNRAFTPAFGTPSQFIEPRRTMFGVKVAF